MSFFDEGDEPRTTRVPRPRPASVGGGGGGADQTVLVRRAVAAGVALILLILIVVGIKGCLDSRRKDAMRSYANNVSQLVNQSDQQVGQPLFTALESSQGKSPLDVQVQIDQLRVNAEGQAQQARNLSVPGQMGGAQQHFLLVMDLRAEAVKRVADNIRSALGGQTASQAVSTIAGEMESLLASDVIYARRVKPLVEQQLRDQGINAPSVASTQFVPDLGWVVPDTVAQRIVGHTVGGSGGAVKPGLHGHSMQSVSVGSTTLTPGTTVNAIKLTPNAAFDVKVVNGGTNDEFGVVVTLKIQGSGAPITLSKTIDTSKAGATTDVLIPLGQTPPVGTPLRITATVAPVPGEKNLANNALSYLAVFSR